MGKVKPAWLTGSPVWALLPLWIVFAALWVVVSSRYNLHLSVFPLPQLGSLSMSIVALLLYVPPVVMLLSLTGLRRKGGSIAKALHILGWALAALLILVLAFAAPTFFQIVTE